MLTFIQLCQQEHKLSRNREQTVSTVFPRFVIVFAVIEVFRLNLSIRDLEALGGFNHFTPIRGSAYPCLGSLDTRLGTAPEPYVLLHPGRD